MPLDITPIPNSAGLFAALRQVDISVPARIDGRHTHHTETWTICRLIATLAKADLLDFPVSVTHRDRPDFLIQTGSAKLGVEVTEAISEQYAAYCALGEREFPEVFLEPAHFRWGGPKLTVEQMRELLCQSQLTSDGWSGDRPEQEWAFFIQSVVETKLAKLARPDFVKFDQNWLSVYDNLPLPHIHLGKAITFLRPLLQDSWPRIPTFDTLFVERGPVVARISAKGSDHLLLNDLWE